MKRMSDHGWTVTGLDAAVGAVRQIQEELGLKAIVGTLPHPELQPGSFDGHHDVAFAGACPSAPRDFTRGVRLTRTRRQAHCGLSEHRQLGVSTVSIVVVRVGCAAASGSLYADDVAGNADDRRLRCATGASDSAQRLAAFQCEVGDAEPLRDRVAAGVVVEAVSEGDRVVDPCSRFKRLHVGRGGTSEVSRGSIHIELLTAPAVSHALM